MELVIYGAKSLALGMYCAIHKLYAEYPIRCFLVSSLVGNPELLAGLPVKEIKSFSNEVNKEDVHVLIGTPEDIHPEIIEQLKKYGFCHYTCMDSRREAILMEKYFSKMGMFCSIHSLPKGGGRADLEIFMAKSCKDRPLSNPFGFRIGVYPLQVGAELTEVRIADFQDNTGENISAKNGNYCELTALYWIWKNRLTGESINDAGVYYGLFQYRRILDISEDDLQRMKGNNVDAILQFPTLHEPDIREHHARYVRKSDWEAVLQALKELQPGQVEAFRKILEQPYFYNYNLIIAKGDVLEKYCSWLFPILERIEELSTPRGWERCDRYIGYLGESLMTLYFLYHQSDLKIYHTGRLMLT